MTDILPHFDPSDNHLYLEGRKTPLRVAMYLDKTKYRDSWVHIFSPTNFATRQITSVVALKVWQELLHYLAINPASRNSSNVFIEHSFIAKTLNIDSSGVTKAISDLKKVGLVLDLKQRKKITINPLYAWNGNLRLWQDTVEDYLAKGIITLPTTQSFGDNND